VVPEVVESVAAGRPDSATVNGYAPVVLAVYTDMVTGLGEPTVYNCEIGFGLRLIAGTSPAASSTSSVKILVSVLPVESVKVIEMKYAPGWVGTPERNPDELSVRPVGMSEPVLNAIA
jgi:hypothetical protein